MAKQNIAEELERLIAEAKVAKRESWNAYTSATSGMRESFKAKWAKDCERLRNLIIAAKIVNELAGGGQ